MERTTQKKRFTQKLVLIIIAIALISAYLAHGQITQVEFSGSYTPELETEVKDMVLRSWWSRSKFAINPAELEAKINNLDSSISEVEVSKPILGNVLKVNIVSRVPFALWQTVDNANQKFAVDNKGTLYTPDQSLPDGLPLIKDTSGIHYELSQQVLLPQYMDFISRFEDELRLSRLPKAEIEHHAYELPDSSRELVVAFDSEPYVYRLIITRSPASQLAELVEMEEYLKKAGITPREYIDLRVANRAYYK